MSGQRYGGKITFKLPPLGRLTEVATTAMGENWTPFGLVLCSALAGNKIISRSVIPPVKLGMKYIKTCSALEVEINSGCSNYKAKYSQRGNGKNPWRKANTLLLASTINPTVLF